MTVYLRLLGRRIQSSIRLVIALAFGTTIAAALMAATMIYADSLEVLGLDFALDQSSPSELDMLASSSGRLNASEGARIASTLETTGQQAFAPVLDGQVRSYTSGTLYPAPAGQPVDTESDLRPRAYLQSRSGLAENVTVEGAMPAPRTDGTYEAVIGAPAAERLGVSIGDEFDLLPFWDLEAETIRIRVTGLISPNDLTSDYWTGASQAFDIRTTRWATYGFFLDETVLVQDIGSRYPAMPGDISVLNRIDADAITPDGVASLRTALESHANNLNRDLQVARLSSTLPDVLSAFSDRLTFSRIPLFLVALQVVGIALFYLVMVAALHVSQQSGEISLLKSRGATTKQILALYLGEGVVLLLVAVLLGPPLAALAVALLGITPVFNDLTGGSLLHVTISGTAWLVALGGAAAAVLALIVPAWIAARRTVVEYKRSSGRPSVASFIFRYYLDLAIVGVLLLFLFDLQSQGQLASRNVFGEMETDPILLMTPALFFLVTGFVFLRLFPLLLKLVNIVVDLVASTSFAIAFAHLVRNPSRYGLLIMLLVLATSLGMFASTFGSTLNANLRDRALYETGATVRFNDLRPRTVSPERYEEVLAGQPGVDSFSGIVTANGSYRSSSFRSVDASIIGVDDRIAETAYFRDDFASGSLASIEEQLGTGAFQWPELPAVPADATALGVWVFAGPESGGFEVHLQLRDAAGAVSDVTLAPYTAAGTLLEQGEELEGEEPAWYFFAAPLEEDVLTDAIQPVGVQSVSISRTFRRGDDRATFLFDNLQSFQWTGTGAPAPLTDPGAATILEPFDTLDRWEIIDGNTAEPRRDVAALETNEVYDGTGAASVSWTQPVSSSVLRGVRIRGPQEPMPIAASDAFLAQSGFEVGSTFRLFTQGSYLQSVIVARLSYFPTLPDPANDPFILVDQDRFRYYTGRLPGANSTPGVAELWIHGGDEGIDVQAITALLPADAEEPLLLRDALFSREEDPLAVAGWQGILLLSFVAVLVLSAIGFVLFAYLSARSRRLEFGVLRTIGLTRFQVGTSVAVEQAIVVLLGVATGSLIALQLGPQMIDFLGFTESGGDVVPPYRNVTDWATVAITYGTIMAVFVIATVAIIALYLREAIHRVLRLGEL